MADPALPYAQVVHRVLGVGADTDADADLHPDLSVLAGLTVTFTPQPSVIKWLGTGGPVTHPNKVVTGVYDSTGRLRLMQDSAQEGDWLLASSHEDMVPSGWTWFARWSLGAIPAVTFAAPPGAGVVVAAGFEFDVPVRFDTDMLDVTLDFERLGSITSIPLIEVRK